MLGIIKPSSEFDSIQCSKICQALNYSEIEFIAFSENEMSVFDIIKRFNVTKIISSEDERSDTVVRAAEKNNIPFEVREMELCSNLLITLNASIEDIYKCDECCVQSYSFESEKDLGKRLDNSYNRFFRLYSNFLHAYTCYCGALKPEKLGTAVKSADSVVCLSETAYHDFKLLNKNITMANGSSPADVKTNFDLAFEFSNDIRCLNRKVDFDINQ